ncbi:B12-binding domain-containing radical SAM protein [Desulfogranum japonicum]|uniref:B12-binding domain-containing radical SAM protein n=1 Tax=Desulfogranum japonicum TaxID=231447 RepID=UPI000412BF10|nr:B12-binding domain-containing radical SAM protein [Desulfogranum japonicum]
MAENIAIGYLSINPPAHQVDWQNHKMFAGSVAVADTDKKLDYFHVIPYQYGLLRAYLTQYYDLECIFQLPLFIRSSVDDCAVPLAANDIVAYSCYPWNHEYHLQVAKRVKELCGSVLNVFGGPTLPLDAEQFLRQHPYVDIICFGEGEKAFAEIVKHFGTRQWEYAPGIAWLNEQDDYCHTAASLLTESELQACMSPYSMGVFRELMEQYPDIVWQMPMETNRGCPFGCKYCFWAHTDHRKVRQFSWDRSVGELKWAIDHNISNILVCDANFGLLKRDEALVDLVIDHSKQKKIIKSFIVQTPCEPGERGISIHRKLIENHLSCPITVGVQSRSEKVLNISGRRYQDRARLKQIFARYKHIKAQYYCDLILGLPGESYQSFTAGLAEVIACGQHDSCYIYFFSPLVNTVMHSTRFREQYGLKTVRQKTIPPHANADTGNRIDEYQEIVVASRDMPEEEWKKAVVFKWLCQFLFFSRMLHVPLCLGMCYYDLDLRETIECFMTPDRKRYPLLAEIADRLFTQADKIQTQGETELVHSEYTVPVLWPMEQALILELVHRDLLDGFYAESEDLLVPLVTGGSDARQLVAQGCQLNQTLVRRPFVQGDTVWEGDYNLRELYRGMQGNTIVVPEQGAYRYQIIRTRPEWDSWQGWHNHIQFCHLQKKYYLYGLKKI